jgi:hypothetical protein
MGPRLYRPGAYSRAPSNWQAAQDQANTMPVNRSAWFRLRPDLAFMVQSCRCVLLSSALCRAMLVRMADTKVSAAARELLRARWGDQVVSRAAQTVIERAAELPEAKRAEVLERLQREDVSADD